MKEQTLEYKDFKSYQPYNTPMLKLLFTLTLASIAATALYEFIL